MIEVVERLHRLRAIDLLLFALVLVAVGAIAASAFTSTLKAWWPNIAVGAISIVVTVGLVGYIVRREADRRIRPRLDRVLMLIGLNVQDMVGSLVLDYAATHVGTYKALPRNVDSAIELWLKGLDDADRPPLVYNGEDAVLSAANALGRELAGFRTNDLDVLDSRLVVAIEEFSQTVNLGMFSVAVHESPPNRLGELSDPAAEMKDHAKRLSDARRAAYRAIGTRLAKLVLAYRDQAGAACVMELPPLYGDAGATIHRNRLAEC
jgi:hypothetical protein